MRPMTMTMATQDTMSAWFWMMNSWLRIGKFLLAEDFLPLIGAIFENIQWMPRKCVLNTCRKLSVKRDYKNMCTVRVVEARMDYIEKVIFVVVGIWVVSVWQLRWLFTGCWCVNIQKYTHYTCRRVFTFSIVITERSVKKYKKYINNSTLQYIFWPLDAAVLR